MNDHAENTEENRNLMREIAKETTFTAARYGVSGTHTAIILGGVALALVSMARALNVDKDALKGVLEQNVELVYGSEEFNPGSTTPVQ